MCYAGVFQSPYYLEFKGTVLSLLNQDVLRKENNDLIKRIEDSKGKVDWILLNYDTELLKRLLKVNKITLVVPDAKLIDSWGNRNYFKELDVLGEQSFLRVYITHIRELLWEATLLQDENLEVLTLESKNEILTVNKLKKFKERCKKCKKKS